MRKIVLKKNHTHAGAQYLAGASILLDETDADWLASAEITEKVATRTIVEPNSRTEEEVVRV